MSSALGSSPVAAWTSELYELTSYCELHLTSSALCVSINYISVLLHDSPVDIKPVRITLVALKTFGPVYASPTVTSQQT